MTKQEKLDKLNSKISQCSACALRTDCNRIVPGEGTADADIFFIGEAPGKKEDESGRPFVGAAGKFLDEMIMSTGLDRSQVYISNIVKCRPPSNRDPQPEEIKKCWPWLEKQIILIDPKIIVTLGRHSMKNFFPNLKISNSHGKAIHKDFPVIGEKILCILYHPAAALYNGSMREALLRDFKKIPKILVKIKKEGGTL